MLNTNLEVMDLNLTGSSLAHWLLGNESSLKANFRQPRSRDLFPAEHPSPPPSTLTPLSSAQKSSVFATRTLYASGTFVTVFSLRTVCSKQAKGERVETTRPKLG